jgi:hypothetical protein
MVNTVHKDATLTAENKLVTHKMATVMDAYQERKGQYVIKVILERLLRYTLCLSIKQILIIYTLLNKKKCILTDTYTQIKETCIQIICVHYITCFIHLHQLHFLLVDIFWQCTIPLTLLRLAERRGE